MENIEKKEKIFQEKILIDPTKSEEAFLKLEKYFSDKDAQFDYTQTIPQFRWFTLLIWQRFSTFPDDIIIKYAFRRQIPLALKLGFDVWKELIWYLSVWTSPFLPEERENLYSQIQKAFFDSNAIIGVLQGKNYTLKNAIDEIRLLNSESSSATRDTEFKNKLKGIFFPKDNQQESFFSAKDDEVVDSLIGLVNFFDGIKADRITYVIDAYIYPELENNKNIESTSEITDQKNINNSESRTYSSEPKPVVSMPAKKETPMFSKKPNDVKKPEEIIKVKADETLTAPKALDMPVVVSSKKEEKKPAPAIIKKFSYKEIRRQIDSQFAKDGGGQFINITDVLAQLQKISSSQNDPRIKDLYYFNQQSGGFEWNENLFKD